MNIKQPHNPSIRLGSQNTFLITLRHSKDFETQVIYYHGNYDHGFCKGAVVEDHKADLYESLLMMTTVRRSKIIETKVPFDKLSWYTEIATFH